MPNGAARGRMIEKLKEVLKEAIDKDTAAELIPNDENEAEQYLLLGRQDAILANLSLLMAIRQMFRDYYEPHVGVPYRAYIEENPTPLSIQIHWRISKKKPFEPKDLIAELRQQGRLNRPTPPRPFCTIVNVKREAITWENVKTAAGGLNGYTYGRFYAAANIGNRENNKVGRGGVMKVYAGSGSEAITRLEALLALTNQQTWTITSGEERADKGVRATNIRYQKPEIRVYPAFFTIFNYGLVSDTLSALDAENSQQIPIGRATALGNKLKKCLNIPLWCPRAPTGVQERINDAMRRADT